MGKKYIGRIMIDKSRFIKYLETMPKEEVNKVASYVDNYVKENKEYCDKDIT